MKVLLVGATGAIGGVVLQHCLAHPDTTTVVAFTRRTLSQELLSHPKLQCAIISSFEKWPEDVLIEHSDAKAMIWAIGTYDGSPQVNLEYPMTFQKSFAHILERRKQDRQFRYIHVSGRFAEVDQEKKLFFYNDSRKIRGKHQVESLNFAEEHEELWRSFIVRPGGVVMPSMLAKGLISAIVGSITIHVDELAAYITYLAVGGDEKHDVIHNERMVEKGRQLLNSG